MEKIDRSAFEDHFEVVIRCKNDKVERSVSLNGQEIYREWFGNTGEWRYGGGNFALDLFESRFRYPVFFRERTFDCLWKSPSPVEKGIRVILAKILRIQVYVVNRLFNRRSNRWKGHLK